jgi:hypothetical protein
MSFGREPVLGCSYGLALAVLLGSRVALATPPHARAGVALQHPFEVGFRSGFGVPVGSLEHGTQASDLSYGGVPFSLDATYAFAPNLSAGAFAAYALAIPKLCDSASDCRSSLGSDASIGVLFRANLPALGVVIPELEFGSGYEWLARRYVDHGATSTRSFSGPLLARVACIPTVRVGSRTSLGLAIGVSVGVAVRAGLEAPGVARSGDTNGASPHGSWDLGIRFAVAF